MKTRITPAGQIPQLLLFAQLLLLPHWSEADNTSIAVTITDDAPYHVHAPGEYFKISVTIDCHPDTIVQYYWKDFRGASLTRPVTLNTRRPASIQSPAKDAGYYELVLKSTSTGQALPQRRPGEERGYGFAILPRPSKPESPADPKSKFGVVHADIDDPYLPDWVKTMTWNTTSAKWWGYEMEKRRASGKLELPIISRSYWQSDDSKPIASSQLDRLGLRVKAYFSASPSTLYWETGIEENIKSRYRERYYWENLENKLRVVREIADGVNPDIKLIYQIAGLKQQAVSNFASSRASRLIDILSIHPYAWPDFPSPETWHDSYIQQARRQLQFSRGAPFLHFVTLTCPTGLKP